MARFSETVFLESAPAVDADKGVLSGVKLLGAESRNGRRYQAAAMKEAVKLYKGRKIYVDHPTRESAGHDRSMSDWAGTIQNARYESDGIYGDVKLRKASPHFQGIIEAAREFPKDVGFSHVADGESRYEGETEIVESIKEVFSVDLVTDPATTAGFFESARPKHKTVKAAVESLPESPIRKRLVEMMAGGLMDGSLSLDDEKASDPLAQMASIIKSLIQQLGDALNALAEKKDSPPPQVNPATNPAQPAPEDDMANDPAKQQDDNPFAGDDPKKKDDPGAKPSYESLQSENAELKAKGLLLESGREATAARVKALARETDEAARKELLESWPVAEGSVERPFTSPALIESEHADFPREPKQFADSLR